MKADSDLARRVDAAQSILSTDTAESARLLERAYAECSRETVRAMARLYPGAGAAVRDVAGGLALFAGEGSPYTQGLAMGLHGDVSEADLDLLEATVRPSGTGSVQLEICPYVAPTLVRILASRAYHVHEWQLVWTTPLPAEIAETAHPYDPNLLVRPMQPGEEDIYFRTVMAGFLETEDVPPDAIALMRPSAFAARHEQYLAFLGDEPVGGGGIAWDSGILFVNGSAVRPSFRRRGVQAALLRARLARGLDLGCHTAYSSTLPGTASRRNMERHGFHVAYPKLVMLRA